MNSGKNSIIFFAGSVVFVLLGIMVITILGTSAKNEDGTTTDIRAKAAVSSALKFVGLVTEIDEVNNTVTVDNLMFEDAETGSKSLGTWTVTPPANVSVTSLSPGTKVIISVVAETFIASSKTLTATAIVPMR